MQRKPQTDATFQGKPPLVAYKQYELVTEVGVPIWGDGTIFKTK